MKEELKTRISHWKSTVFGWFIGACSIAFPILAGQPLENLTWTQIGIAIAFGLVGTFARDDHFKRDKS